MEIMTNALVVNTERLAPDTVERIRHAVAEILAEVGVSEPSASTVGGWTEETAAELCRRLVRGHRPIQAQAIVAAAANGGFIDRAAVYELAGYSEGRSLRGWSRPINRLVTTMITERRIPSDALVPLTAVYDPTNASFQQTGGFRMPVELVEIFAGALSGDLPTTGANR